MIIIFLFLFLFLFFLQEVLLQIFSEIAAPLSSGRWALRLGDSNSPYPAFSLTAGLYARFNNYSC